MPHLVFIYGPPFSGKSSVARALAASLPEKTALLDVDSLARDAIAVHDEDVFAELDMVHTQVRLLAANYLKNRYNLIVEGAFSYQRDGVLHRNEQEIDQIAALMRSLAPAPVFVRLNVSEASLHERAKQSGRETEMEAALRMHSVYKTRYGQRSLVLDAEAGTAEDAAEAILKQLRSLESA